MSRQLSSDDELREVLANAKTIAVLGAHEQPQKAAFYVPDYLAGHGYRIIPVNPRLLGKRLWNAEVIAGLSQINEPVDILDVFRRPEALRDHLPEILAMEPLPKLVWLQLGIRNDEVAQALTQAGITVVQDRCTLAEHRRLL